MSNGSCSVQGSLMCTKAINLSALYPNDTNRIDFKDTKFLLGPSLDAPKLCLCCSGVERCYWVLVSYLGIGC